MRRRCAGNPRVRSVETRVLSDDWYVLRKATFDGKTVLLLQWAATALSR
jgi:hypothetical protein